MALSDKDLTKKLEAFVKDQAEKILKG